MKRNLNRVIIGIMTVILITSSISIYGLAATENKESDYEIKTVKELKNEIKSLKQADKLDRKMQKKIIKKTSPEILVDFIEEKTEDAVDAFNTIDADEVLKEVAPGKMYGKTSVDLGDGCEAIVEFEDGVDLNIFQKISSLTSMQAYAASNGEEMWKDYGNRYFTAKSTVEMGFGFAVLVLENHYKLSANGIDERYGEAYTDLSLSVILTGTASPGDIVITDASARTPGASDVNMHTTFDIVLNGAGVVNGQLAYKLSTTVKYLDINTSKKQVKVKHSWKVER